MTVALVFANRSVIAASRNKHTLQQLIGNDEASRIKLVISTRDGDADRKVLKAATASGKRADRCLQRLLSSAGLSVSFEGWREGHPGSVSFDYAHKMINITVRGNSMAGTDAPAKVSQSVEMGSLKLDEMTTTAFKFGQFEEAIVKHAEENPGSEKMTVLAIA